MTRLWTGDLGTCWNYTLRVVLYRRFSAYDLLRRMIKKFITFHLVEKSIEVLWLEILSCVPNWLVSCAAFAQPFHCTLFGYGTVLSANSFVVKFSSSFHDDALGAQTGCRGPRMGPRLDAHQNRTIYAQSLCPQRKLALHEIFYTIGVYAPVSPKLFLGL